MQNSASPKGRTGFIIAIAAIIVFAGISVYNYRKYKTQTIKTTDKHEMIPVNVALSERRYFNWMLEQTGDIRPLLEVDIYPRISGEIIRELYVEKVQNNRIEN